MVSVRSRKEKLDNRSFLNGAIYLYKRKGAKKGCWDIRLKIYGHKGYVHRTSGTADEHEAYARAYDLYMDCVAKQRAGHGLDSRRISTGLDAFVQHHEGQAVARNFRFTLSMARLLKPFVNKRTFSEIDTVFVRQMLDYIANQSTRGQLSANTHRRNLSRLKTILNWWCEQGYLTKVPKAPSLPAEKRRRPDFSQEDWIKLTEAMTRFVQIEHGPVRRDRTLLVNWIMIMGNTGLRTGEAERLRWLDIRPIVDANDPTKINVALNVNGKTGRRTAIASTGDVRTYFTAILEIRKKDLENPASDIYREKDVPTDSYVFCHSNGKPIKSFKKSFASLLSAAGVTSNSDGERRTPYSLRHTYATFRLNNGVQEYHLARNMGTSVAMLEQHYGHTSNTANVDELTKQMMGKPRSRSEKTGLNTASLDWLAA